MTNPMTLTKPRREASASELDQLLRQARKASTMLKTLSHETRLLILCLLCEGEKSVSDLEAILQLPQATVSQHLMRLRFDRWVKTRREGRQIYYSLANDELDGVISGLCEIFCAPGTGKGQFSDPG